jgi:aminoglycoside/choline kinase family phosphotransferase
MQGAVILPPSSLSEVTPAWLTRALAQRHRGVQVEAVEFGEAIHGTGTNVALSLRYARQPEGETLPEKLWLKAGYEKHFEYMAPSRIYEIEALFYRELAPRLGIKVPRCHYAGNDPDTHQGLMLFEDLEAQDVSFGNATRPVSAETVARGLSALARLHASSWSQGWARMLWYVQHGIPVEGPQAAWYRDQTPEVFARYIAERVEAHTPASVNAPQRIVDAFWKLAAMSRAEPCCLIHSDCHLDNFYFDANGEPGLLDWQSPRLGCWAWDVSYFIISALDIDVRRGNERALIAHYLGELRAHGIDAPTMDAAWLAYRRYNAYGLFVKIVNPDVFKPREINVAWMSRHVAAADDLETFASLRV